MWLLQAELRRRAYRRHSKVFRFTIMCCTSSPTTQHPSDCSRPPAMQQRQIGGAAAEAVAFRTAAAPSSWAGPRATHYILIGITYTVRHAVHARHENARKGFVSRFRSRCSKWAAWERKQSPSPRPLALARTHRNTILLDVVVRVARAMCGMYR